MTYEPPPVDDQPYLVHLQPEPDGEPIYRRKRLILPAAAAVAVIGIAAAGFLTIGGDDDRQLTSADPTPYRSTTSVSATPSAVPSPAPSPAVTRPGTSASPSPSPSVGSVRPTTTAPSASVPASKKAAAATTAPATAAAFRGTGAKVVAFPRTIRTPMLMTTTRRGGDGPLTVHALSTDGKGDDLLVTATGAYVGQALFNAGGKDMSGLRIQGSGSWTVTLADLGTARVWTGNGTCTGTGDSVVRVAGVFDSGDTMKFVSRGARSAVTVRSYAADGDDELVVDDLENFSSEYEVPDATAYLVVRTDGTWTFRKL